MAGSGLGRAMHGSMVCSVLVWVRRRLECARLRSKEAIGAVFLRRNGESAWCTAMRHVK